MKRVILLSALWPAMLAAQPAGRQPTDVFIREQAGLPAASAKGEIEIIDVGHHALETMLSIVANRGPGGWHVSFACAQSPHCAPGADHYARDYVLSAAAGGEVDAILAELKTGGEPDGQLPSPNFIGGQLAVSIDYRGFRRDYHRVGAWGKRWGGSSNCSPGRRIGRKGPLMRCAVLSLLYPRSNVPGVSPMNLLTTSRSRLPMKRVRLPAALLLAAVLVAAAPPPKAPDCSGPGRWPAKMAFTKLKNAGLIANGAVDFTRVESRTIVSQRTGRDLWRQAFRIVFPLKSGGKVEAIAVSDASGEECSMGEPQVFVVSRTL